MKLRQFRIHQREIIRATLQNVSTPTKELAIITKFGKRVFGARRAAIIQNIASESPRERAARYTRLIEASLDTIVELTVDGVYLFVSPNSVNVFGYHPEELLGRSAFELIHPDDVAKAFAIFAEAIISMKPAEVVFRYKHADGRWLWIESRGRAFYHARTISVSIISRDITERIQEQEQLSYVAHHDPLTGLPNRILLRDRLNRAITAAGRNRGQEVVLLLLDLNHFKKINDTLGHAAGDEVLCKVAARLSALLREADTLARLGGDEFAILLSEVKEARDAAEKVAGKVLKSLVQPFRVGNDKLVVGTAIGIACYPGDGDDEDALMNRADIAMYRAKRQAVGYQFYDAAIDSH